MKLYYFEYSVHVTSYHSHLSDSSKKPVIGLRLAHLSGVEYPFFIYPNSSGWDDPGIWCPEITRLFNQSKHSDASDLYRLLKTLVKMNLKSILGDEQ